MITLNWSHLILVVIVVLMPWRRLILTWRYKRDTGLSYTWRRAWRAAGRPVVLP